MLAPRSLCLVILYTFVVAHSAPADSNIRLLSEPEASLVAEPLPALPDPRVPTWTAHVEAGVWFVAPSGDLKLPVSSGSGPGSFTTSGDSVKLERLNLDSARLQPTGEVHLASGRWRAFFSGAVFSLDRDRTTADSSFRLGAVEVVDGDPLSVEMDFTTVEVSGGYSLWGHDFAAASEHPENAFQALLRVSVLGGARMYDVGFNVASFGSSPASAGADQFFLEPIVGLRAEADLADDFSIDLQVSGGGFADSDRSSYSVDIAAGFTWRPTRHVGLQIGYRQLAFGLADGDDLDEFEYDGRLAGLMVNLVVRF